jgi:hypothetical protein
VGSSTADHVQAHFATGTVESSQSFNSRDHSSNQSADERDLHSGSGGRQQQQHHQQRPKNSAPELEWRKTLEDAI